MTTAKRKLAGGPRKLTDAQVQKLKEWKPFKELCREIGISVSQGQKVRRGYYYKQPSPDGRDM